MSSDRALIFWMCVGQVGALLPLSTVAALVPFFIDTWGLSNTGAGWLAGAIYVGYMGAVPFLAAITDRIDARKVFIASNALAAAAALGMGLFADGIASGAIWRIAGGIGLAGSYMPGLKALTDRIRTVEPSRAVVAYTASYSIGAGLSYLFAGALADLIGWRGMFIASAAGPLAPFLVGCFLRPMPVVAAGQAALGALLDFRPVFRNREAMGYVLAYTAHCHELSIFRAWLVAFLVFAGTQYPDAAVFAAPILMATLLTLVGLPASIAGNELALRFGRPRALKAIMTISAAVGCMVGWSTGLPAVAVFVLLLVYSFTVVADSGALTAGAVAAARPEAKGATMALHSTLGFGVSFLGPVLFGLALDLGGGESRPVAWALAFSLCGLSVLFGPLALRWAARRD